LSKKALQEALLMYGKPEVFNTEHGCQFTSEDFTGVLENNGIAISMNGNWCILPAFYV